jgi:hypothetical protein
MKNFTITVSKKILGNSTKKGEKSGKATESKNSKK